MGLQRVRYDLATKQQQYFKVYYQKQTKKASPLPRSGEPPLASPLLLAALKKTKNQQKYVKSAKLSNLKVRSTLKLWCVHAQSVSCVRLFVTP